MRCQHIPCEPSLCCSHVKRKAPEGHDTAKLQHAVASPKTRVPNYLSTHAKKPISLQKASERAKSCVIVSYGEFGSLGDVGAIAKHAVCGYIVMLVYSRFG